MFCDAYKESLTEAIAAGTELTPLLHRHLSACESCRTAFAEEQSLFAAIDAGLRSVAKPEVPVTLIPRVHVSLKNEPAERKISFASVVWSLTGAAAAMAIIAGLLYLPSKGKPLTVALPTPLVASQVPPTTTSLNSAQMGGVSHLPVEKQPALVATKYSAPVQPEVLVSPDEGIALRSYEEFLRKKSARIILVASAGPPDVRPGIEPLQIKEIEIPVLSKPYVDADR